MLGTKGQLLILFTIKEVLAMTHHALAAAGCFISLLPIDKLGWIFPYPSPGNVPTGVQPLERVSFVLI